jgi:ADP-heptose:LPS heptosyltransferase
MRVLVQRYSALGDILILLPILQQLKKDYPDVELAFVSKPFLEPLFGDLNIRFFPAQVKKKHKGLKGLNRLAREINKDFKPDLVIDAHMVLRSMIVSRSFQLLGTKLQTIRKERPARKRFLAAKPGERAALHPISQLHLETFARAGFKLNFNREAIPIAPYKLNGDSERWWSQHKAAQNIGIAPGARHLSKAWPKQRYIELLQETKQAQRKFFLFGGKDEQDLLQEIAEQSGTPCEVVAGKFSLDQEIALCKELDVFVSNDSSNMHLAAWAKTPVVSIWGGTHPDAGFAPYANEDQIVQLEDDELDCRPCSIFGTSECARGDFACLHHIKADRVAQKIECILA